MPTITAIAPILPCLAIAPSKPGGDDPNFAPLLAGLLAGEDPATPSANVGAKVSVSASDTQTRTDLSEAGVAIVTPALPVADGDPVIPVAPAVVPPPADPGPAMPGTDLPADGSFSPAVAATTAVATRPQPVVADQPIVPDRAPVKPIDARLPDGPRLNLARTAPDRPARFSPSPARLSPDATDDVSEAEPTDAPLPTAQILPDPQAAALPPPIAAAVAVSRPASSPVPIVALPEFPVSTRQAAVEPSPEPVGGRVRPGSKDVGGGSIPFSAPSKPMPEVSVEALEAELSVLAASSGQGPPAPTAAPDIRKATSRIVSTADTMAGDPPNGSPLSAPPLPAAPRPPTSVQDLPASPAPSVTPAVPTQPIAASTPAPVMTIAASPAPVAPNTPAPPEPTARAVATPSLPVPASAAILPALQAFGAALHRAATDERRPMTRTSAAMPAVVGIAAPASPPIAPLADKPAPLDLTQARWPETMVAHIERLRDAADASDTRIRLHPDALGHLDIGVRREGDAVRVHFTAAEPATRALLADAQPRLVELAEARGLKLSGTQVDSGNADGGSRRPPATPASPLPARPARATATSADADPSTDTRLA